MSTAEGTEVYVPAEPLSLQGGHHGSDGVEDIGRGPHGRSSSEYLTMHARATGAGMAGDGASIPEEPARERAKHTNAAPTNEADSKSGQLKLHSCTQSGIHMGSICTDTATKPECRLGVIPPGEHSGLAVSAAGIPIVASAIAAAVTMVMPVPMSSLLKRKTARIIRRPTSTATLIKITARRALSSHAGRAQPNAIDGIVGDILIPVRRSRSGNTLPSVPAVTTASDHHRGIAAGSTHLTLRCGPRL